MSPTRVLRPTVGVPPTGKRKNRWFVTSPWVTHDDLTEYPPRDFPVSGPPLSQESGSSVVEDTRETGPTLDLTTCPTSSFAEIDQKWYFDWDFRVSGSLV